MSDRWADWLLHGRQRGMDEATQRRLHRGLARLRDRVLRGARLRKGQRVLDIGAGTGLIALGARKRVGPGGLVVAHDISADALRACEREAEGEQDGAPLRSVRADAVHLPFPDGLFDAVFTRSVLIYIEDKPAAIQELHRALRPGGVVSIFEPINSATTPTGGRADWGGDRELGDLAHDHGRIRAYIREGWEHERTMLGFDERDLVRWFAEAGFTAIYSAYEYSYFRAAPRQRSAEQILMSLRQRPNPSMLSYEEGARAVLGDAADAYLARFVEVSRKQPGIHVGALVYLTAVKEGGRRRVS